MLPPLPRCSRWSYSSLKLAPSISAFPDSTIASACTSSFSRFARRSLALRPAHSRSHQIRDRYPGASDISSPPCLPRLLPAGAIAGWALHPLEKRRLVTAHVESRHSHLISAQAKWLFLHRRQPQCENLDFWHIGLFCLPPLYFVLNLVLPCSPLITPLWGPDGLGDSQTCVEGRYR